MGLVLHHAQEEGNELFGISELLLKTVAGKKGAPQVLNHIVGIDLPLKLAVQFEASTSFQLWGVEAHEKGYRRLVLASRPVEQVLELGSVHGLLRNGCAAVCPKALRGCDILNITGRESKVGCGKMLVGFAPLAVRSRDPDKRKRKMEKCTDSSARAVGKSDS
jgi:hypothetical protein